MDTNAKKLQPCLTQIADLQRKINRQLALINGPEMAMDQLRDLNNELNHNQQEKQKLEKQLVSLGGPNYVYQEYKFTFYGRASELPEATTKQFIEPTTFSPSYYGYRPVDQQGHENEDKDRGNGENEGGEWGEFAAPTRAEIEKEIVAARRAKLQSQYFK